MPELKEIKISDFHQQSAWDTFYLTATPRVFEWMRWAGTLAGLKYIQHKVHSPELGFFIGIAGWLVLMYFCAYFYQFSFTGFPFARSPKAKRATSLILSGLLGGAVWWMVDQAVNAILLTQK